MTMDELLDTYAIRYNILQLPNGNIEILHIYSIYVVLNCIDVSLNELYWTTTH